MGECNQCGQCCQLQTPITTGDIQTLIDNDISLSGVNLELNQTILVEHVIDNRYYYFCYYYDTGTSGCTIYEYRPEICAEWYCDGDEFWQAN